MCVSGEKYGCKQEKNVRLIVSLVKFFFSRRMVDTKKQQIIYNVNGKAFSKR